MNITYVPLLGLFIYFISSCTNKLTNYNIFANVQIKSSTCKTINDSKTYYEINYDNLGRIISIVLCSNELIEGTKILFFKSTLEVGALIPNKKGRREGIYEFFDGQQTMFKSKSVNNLFEGEST